MQHLRRTLLGVAASSLTLAGLAIAGVAVNSHLADRQATAGPRASSTPTPAAHAARKSPRAATAPSRLFHSAAPSRSDRTAAATAHVGVPQDWSQHGIVYRQPMTPDEFAAQGLGSQWRGAYEDPRYVLGVAHKLQSQAGGTDTLADARAWRGGPLPPSGGGSGKRNPKLERNPVHRDWSNVLGGGVNGQGGGGNPGIYPAKYNFDIFAAPSCANDFVVYPTNSPGATATGDTQYWVFQFTGNPGNNQKFNIGLPGTRRVVLKSSTSTGAGANAGVNFQVGSSMEITAANLAAAVNRWQGQTGFAAAAGVVDGNLYLLVAPNSTGYMSSNAVSEQLSNVSQSGYSSSGSGTAGQATVVAFNQLYNSTCASSRSVAEAPEVFWAYNTGDGRVVETSPTLSWHDGGKQVAFVQRASNGNSMELVLLKWQQGQGTPGLPATPTFSSSAADYRACVANCALVIPFSGSSNSDNGPAYSSPFVDYRHDVLWVGDGNGRLHKFTGVFKGNPAEVTSGGFPVTVASGMKLSPPIYYDGNVYVGSGSGGAGIGGKLHRVDATTAAVASSIKLAKNNSTGLRASPILDAGSGSVFAFVFDDGGPGTPGGTCTVSENSDDGCRVVARFATGFADGAPPAQRVFIGRGNNVYSTLYGGAFDTAFYNSPDGTGAMYIVGGDPSTTFWPTLWKIPLSGGVMGTPQKGPKLGTDDCNNPSRYDCLDIQWNWSPVTLVNNGSGTERLYFSMPREVGTGTGCSSGACVFQFNLTPSTSWSTSLSAAAALPVSSGTGGIIVDNISNTAGASQVYFLQQGTAGNAIQASQSGLM